MRFNSSKQKDFDQKGNCSIPAMSCFLSACLFKFLFLLSISSSNFLFDFPLQRKQPIILKKEKKNLSFFLLLFRNFHFCFLPLSQLNRRINQHPTSQTSIKHNTKKNQKSKFERNWERKKKLKKRGALKSELARARVTLCFWTSFFFFPFITFCGLSYAILLYSFYFCFQPMETSTSWIQGVLYQFVVSTFK